MDFTDYEMGSKKYERIGEAYINDQWKPIFHAREIRRGRNKGGYEVLYAGKPYVKDGKIMFAISSKIVSVFHVRFKTAEAAGEFDYDNPCPVCGKWLFHDEISPDCPNTKPKKA
jgi:hypothetical protein